MSKSPKKLTAIRAFMSYVARFKGPFWLTAAIFAVSNVVTSIAPWLIGRLTNSLTTANGHVVLWTALVIASSIGHTTLWRLGEVIFLKYLTPHNYRFDDYIFAAVINRPYSYFVDKFTGKVSSYVNLLGHEFRDLMANFHYSYISLVVGMPIIAATMFTVNMPTGLIFLVSLILMLVTGRPLARLSSAAEKKAADERSSLDGLVVDSIANFVSIKAFGSERHEASRLYQRRYAVIDAAKYSYWMGILFWGTMSFFVRWIVWPGTFIFNVYLFAHHQMSLAQMTTFLATIVLFSTYIWDVIWQVSMLNMKVAKIEAAYTYLFKNRNIFKKSLDNEVAPLAPEAFKSSLELRNLSFAYPDKPDMEVLSNINLTIRQGEKVGVVGHSGGGKSTLLKLLLGYYPISQGQLLLDGQPVDNRALTDLTAYVPQDTAVFHRSISDNIAYGKQDATKDEIEAAAKAAQAHDFVMALKDGYKTLVGERGIKLSGGQRQRVAIARAILKGAPLLMLDEATSALDSESEKLIQAALWELMKDRTAIVIAHRLSTIQKMDRIVVMDNGTIVEQGNHIELLQKQGVYARLWAHQSGGFINE